MKKATLTLFFVLIIASLVLSGCDQNGTPTEIPEPQEKEIVEEPSEEPEVEDEVETPVVEEIEPTKQPEDTPVPPTETPVPPTPTPDLPPLPPERVYVTFQTEDGLTLEGYYYPSKYHNSEVVVMMHWAPGIQDDWVSLAYWLQNRLDEFTMTSSKIAKAAEGVPAWFPVLDPNISVGVLTFNFRGYGGSDGPQERDKMYLDAKAAVKYASTLEGVDPARISTLGASTGADGAVDGCQLFNEFFPDDGSCLGALSLSPGSYIGMDYEATVKKLMEEVEPKSVYCFSSENDPTSWETCHNAGGVAYTLVDYASGGHGMDLIVEQIDPDTMLKIVEFFELVYGHPFLAD